MSANDSLLDFYLSCRSGWVVVHLYKKNPSAAAAATVPVIKYSRHRSGCQNFHGCSGGLRNNGCNRRSRKRGPLAGESGGHGGPQRRGHLERGDKH